MLCEKVDCCGCGSCFNVCPRGCIAMERDTEGFEYPVIDESKCIKCKFCKQVCPVLNTVKKSKDSVAYAAINHDIIVRKSSSSGGVFPELAKVALQKKGYVCGTIYENNFIIMHTLSCTEKIVKKMRGAKYAQSNAWNCFKKIQEKLEENFFVLFVGTPCQVAGLNQFLGKDYKSLVTVDMICHGVPSPMVWERYLKERINIDAPGSNIYKVELRNKESGWSRYQYSVKISYENGISYCTEQWKDIYMRGFISNLFLRPSCANCRFKGVGRCSDITLGDYWGIWDQKPEFDDNQGTSLVFTHTLKGKELWNDIAGQFKFVQVNLDDAIQQNPSAVKNSIPHEKRNEFFERYNDEESLIKHIEVQLEETGRIEKSTWSKILRCFSKWREI